MMIIPEGLYKERKEFLKPGAGALLSPALIKAKLLELNFKADENANNFNLSDEKLATNYVNFYEFSVNREEAVEHAKNFTTKNWEVSMEGEAEKPLKLSMKDLLAFPLEERIYRFRCVETQSMVVPWIGLELRHLMDKVKPTSEAKFIKFTTLFDKSRLPDQNAFFPTLKYPYAGGLRLDKMMNPLSTLAVGMYKKPFLTQNGAPIRLVVPWKYGFKSVKSIAKIESVKEQPVSTWQAYAPDEYGFYTNVNPEVSHPRWSQADERALGELFAKPTPLFNGYKKEVAHLYASMDLRANF